MRVPRNVSGEDLVNGLTRVGYEQNRQRGSHVRMTTRINGEHHVTVPLHRPIGIGTLSALSVRAPRIFRLRASSCSSRWTFDR